MSKTLKIGSREAKIMLRAGSFEGDRQQLRRKAAAFWHDFSATVREVAVESGGKLSISDRRQIRFYDSRDLGLRGRSYLLRERCEIRSGGRTVTLKFRHPDRYVASASRVTAAKGFNAATKFEDDIKPPYQSLYSHSTTVGIRPTRRLERLGDAARLFPDLPYALDDYDPREPLALVGGLVVRELVLSGGRMRIRKSPKLDAECAIILWYEAAGDEQRPLVAEFSFRYGDLDESYPAKVVQRAYRIYGALQGESMSNWIDGEAMTKTGYVYGRPGEAASSDAVGEL